VKIRNGYDGVGEILEMYEEWNLHLLQKAINGKGKFKVVFLKIETNFHGA
jgi:hypothetical protein